MAEYVTKEEVEAAVQKFKSGNTNSNEGYIYSFGFNDSMTENCTGIFNVDKLGESWNTDGGEKQVGSLKKEVDTYEENLKKVVNSVKDIQAALTDLKVRYEKAAVQEWG